MMIRIKAETIDYSPYMRAAAAVTLLHRPLNDSDNDNAPDYCSECEHDWPCRTIQIIDKEISQ